MKLASLLLLLYLTLYAHAQPGDAVRIGPGDLLSIEVFDVPELKQDVRVNESGDADLALAGKLHLGSLTVQAAAHQIADRLSSDNLVVNPQITVSIREYATQGVTISGEVHHPGIYPILVPQPLPHVIAQAAGLTDLASSKITIKRHSGVEQAVVAPHRKIPADVTIRPGDTVVVERAGIAYILGDVVRSGAYVLQDDGTLSITQLVAMGGGLAPTAKGNRARLVRHANSTAQEFRVNISEILRGRAPDLLLQPDDILFIPNSAWKMAASRLQNLTHIMPGARIGAGCNLGDHAFVESGVTLGDNVTVKNGVALWEGVTAEDNVFIGPNVVFTNDRNPRAEVKKSKSSFLKTHLCEGASLGANVTVVCGIRIGRYAFAGAGAVLTRDVPDYALVVGNPAHLIGYMCECGEKLPPTLLCSCGHRFARQVDGLLRVPF